MKHTVFVMLTILCVVNLNPAYCQNHGLRLGLPGFHQPDPISTTLLSPPAGQRIQGRRSDIFLPEANGDAWDSLFYDNASYFGLIDNVRVTAIVSDSNFIYIAGSFEKFDFGYVTNIVAYDKHMGTWGSLGDGLNSEVLTLALHNGKLYAGGNFTTDGGSQTQPLRHIAMWDGAAWTEIGGGTNATVAAIAFRGNTLVIGGNFTATGTDAYSYLAAWDGSSWSGMNVALNSSVESLLEHGDTLYAGGLFWDNATLLKGVAMYTESNGWQNLDVGLSGDVYALAFFQGKLWAGGDFWRSGDNLTDIFSLAAFDGSSWQTFGPESDLGVRRGWIQTLCPVGDSLYIGGLFPSIAGVAAHSLAIYSNGSFRQAASGVYGSVDVVAAEGASVIVGGTFEQPNDQTQWPHLARMLSGDRWAPVTDLFFGPYGGYSATSVTATAANDRYVFIGGQFTSIEGVSMNHIAMWDKVLHTWDPLGHGLDGDPWCIRVVGDRVYVGGKFQFAGGIPAQHLAFYDLKTRNWSAMGAGSERSVYAMATNGTDVYASTELIHENNRFNSYIGKWDGTSWTRIDHPYIGYAYAMHYFDSKLFLGGYIYSADGSTVNNIAAFDGSAWSGLGDGMNNRVLSLTSIGSDLYAGGWFNASGSTTVSGIARWNGASWWPLGTGLNYASFSLCPRGNNLYVGGGFSTAGGLTAMALARWDGQHWSSVGGGADNSVYSLSTDGKSLYVGGGFTLVSNDFPSYRFAILHFGDADVETASIAPTLSMQSYPNPFADRTTIEYSLRSAADVELAVFDVLGQKVRELVHAQRESGTYSVDLNASNLPAGTYFCRLFAGGHQAIARLSVSK